MQIKDFTEFKIQYESKHHFTDGPWTDSVNWKGLRSEGYTMCIVDGQLMSVGKYGPAEFICLVEKYDN